MLEPVNLEYSVEEYVRYRLAEYCEENAEMKDIEKMTETAEEQMRQAMSGDKEKELLFLNFQDARDMREKKRFMFSLELGVEIAMKMFKDRGLI